MIIYLLKHSNSEFSGTLCGVGFSSGRGSTSSRFDRDRCVAKGCKDISDKVKSIQAAQKKKEEAKAAKAETAELKKKKAIQLVIFSLWKTLKMSGNILITDGTNLTGKWILIPLLLSMANLKEYHSNDKKNS